MFFNIIKSIESGYKQKCPQVELPDFETLNLGSFSPGLEFFTFGEDMTRLNNLIAIKDLPRLVLMFDEVELLVEFGGLDTLAWFRSLIQSMFYSIFLVAGSERLFSFTQDYGSPFYNIFKIVELHPLTYKAAKNLLEIPSADIGMEISRTEVEQILRYTGLSPYFIQGIAHYLVESLNSQKRRQVYPQDVDNVIKEGVNSLSAQFAYIWGGTSVIQKILLVALARKGGPQSADSLLSSVPNLPNLIDSKTQLQEIFDDLVRQQVIFSDVDKNYWFVVPLFVNWLFSEVDDEEIMKLAATTEYDTSQRLNFRATRHLLNK